MTEPLGADWSNPPHVDKGAAEDFRALAGEEPAIRRSRSVPSERPDVIRPAAGQPLGARGTIRHGTAVFSSR